MSAGGRRWLEVSVRSPAAGERAALLADALLSVGGRACEERGAWYATWVEGPADGDLDAFADRVRTALGAETGLDDVEVELRWQEQEDWSEAWRRGLAERRVSERVVVRPTWIEPGDRRPGDVEIVLDPGMAFGTAEHGTTRGCLRLLDGLVRAGDRVLDVGAGSGILSVAAAKLGATDVVAIEGDDLACEALAENVEHNGVADHVTIVRAWATVDSLTGRAPASGVVANLETGIVLPLMPGLLRAVRPGGWLVVSGIPQEEWARVDDVVRAAGWAAGAVDNDGEWRSGLFMRPA